MPACFHPDFCYNFEQLKGSLAKPGHFAILSDDDNGFAMFEKVGKQTYLLAWLGVNPTVRSKGIGRELFQEGIRTCESFVFNSTVLLELHHPCIAKKDEKFGDPIRRIKFYDSLGVKLVNFPYIMPPVAVGTSNRYDHVIGVYSNLDSIPLSVIKDFVLMAPFDNSNRSKYLQDLIGIKENVELLPLNTLLSSWSFGLK